MSYLFRGYKRADLVTIKPTRCVINSFDYNGYANENKAAIVVLSFCRTNGIWSRGLGVKQGDWSTQKGVDLIF